MKEANTSLFNVHKVYSQIVILAFIAHMAFAVVFICLKIYPLMIYNFFSIAFYVILYLILKPKLYSIATAAVHLEVALFTAITTIYLGWAPGYTFYLIALCSLVYFCPYRNIYIPYYFAIGEITLFLILKIYTVNHAPLAPIASSTAINVIYCLNALACVAVILYAAFITNLSGIFARRELVEKNKDLQQQLHHDDLTQLYTRNYLTEKFHKATERSQRMALVLADVDNFKYINDTYGHPCGDYVLFTISTIMKTVCPSGTDICRWGGEEFVLLVYNSNKEEALASIQNLCKAIAAYDFHFEGIDFHVTATFGISFTDEHTTLNELVHLADERMYHGKQTGKNRVIASGSVHTK